MITVKQGLQIYYILLTASYFKGPFFQLYKGNEQEFFPQKFKVIDISIEKQ